MATKAIKGRLVSLSITKEGGAKAKIGELKGASLAIKTGTIDVTSNDSNGFDEFLPGNTNWTISADGLYVSDDAAQVDVIASLTGKTPVAVEFLPVVGAGKPQYTGSAIITSYGEDHTHDGPVAIKIEMQGTGEITKGAQPLV